MEEPSLGERILAHDRERTAHAHESHSQDTEHGVHDELLAAAEQTRRARDTRSELLPEFTGLTAGEALARLAEEETAAAHTPSTVEAPPHPTRTRSAVAPPRTAATKVPPVIPSPITSSVQKTSVKKSTEKREDAEEKPRFEVRV